MEKINGLAGRAPLIFGVDSPRMELSLRIYGEAELPEQVVASQFRIFMKIFESFHQEKTFDPIMKERVYSKVSGSYIESCRKQFMREVAQRIFGQFSFAETLEMLEEHKMHGTIHDPTAIGKITFHQQLSQGLITHSLKRSFRSQGKHFAEEIFKALKDEGVDLQEEQGKQPQSFKEKTFG